MKTSGTQNHTFFTTSTLGGVERYWFGFNTQEKIDEIAGVGNHYTAEFWEYSPRIVQRWNTDPVTRAYKSPYVINSNNPITNNDPDGDCDDCPKPDFKIGVNTSIAFNLGTRTQSSFSVGVGIGFSANTGNVMGSFNLSGRFYGGGLGTTGTTGGQTGMNMDIVASPAVTIGRGSATPMRLNTFNSETYNLTGVNNSFERSITFGSNFVGGGEGNQRVGNIGFRTGDMNFNTYNDFFPIIGDRDDRWWTGGGQIDINMGGGNTLSFGTEVFTGERIRLNQPDPSTGLKYGTFQAGGSTYYQQSPRNSALTNGQTFVQLTNSMGVAGRANFSGVGLINPMYSQNIIHDTFTRFGDLTPRFQSSSPQSFQFGGSLGIVR